MYRTREVEATPMYPWAICATTLLMIVCLLTACGGSSTETPPLQPPNQPPVVTPEQLTRLQLPDLSLTYNQYEGDQVWTQIEYAGGALGYFFKSDPRFAVMASLIDSMGTCAQENGVANWRIYVSRQDLFAVGVMLIVSKNQLTNPTVALSCVLPSGGPGFQFCEGKYYYYASGDTSTCSTVAQRRRSAPTT